MPHRQRALAYEQAMEKLTVAYPDDVEAKILYALVISGDHDLNEKTFARPLKAAGLLEPLFAAYPQHPGVAHYLIHSYDYPPIANKGLEAAKRYAQIAPDAAHAQHMPSYIFTRVGAWRESVASNQASVAAAKSDALYTCTAGTTWSMPPCRWPTTLGPTKWGPCAAHPRAEQSRLGEVFGVAAIPARLALERGRWAEAAVLERPMSVSEAAGSAFRRPRRSTPCPGARRGAQRRRRRHAPGDRAAARPATGARRAQAGVLGRADGGPGEGRHRLGAARRGKERGGARRHARRC